MDTLKIATAGSVDDGKSTLIGRLLFDTKSLKEDKLIALRKSSKKKGLDYIEFSMATDGLIAEREQGITIDVAHIYFSTASKRYIIADTPGHIEYTRNMITGVSNSQASIILIDATKGIVEQTYRHFIINTLFRVKHIIIAINKMDLIEYSEQIFKNIKSDFERLNEKSKYPEQSIKYIPISALTGENVVKRTTNMSWYKGDTILEHLENLNVDNITDKMYARFPVQLVITPNSKNTLSARGYAGKLYGNNLKVGDTIVSLPSLKQSKILEIHFYGDKYFEVESGSSVLILLEDNLDISRGDMIVKINEQPKISSKISAIVCWMDNKNLEIGTQYIIQHNTNKTFAKVESVNKAADFYYTSTSIINNNKLELNEIGEVVVNLSMPIFFDKYADNKYNGAFILIDTHTKVTVGVGLIN